MRLPKLLVLIAVCLLGTVHANVDCPFLEQLHAKFEVTIDVDFRGQHCDTQEFDSITAFIESDMLAVGEDGVAGASFIPEKTCVKPREGKGARRLQGVGGWFVGGEGNCNFCPPEDDDGRRERRLRNTEVSVFENRYIPVFKDSLETSLTSNLSRFDCLKRRGVDVTVDVQKSDTGRAKCD